MKLIRTKIRLLKNFVLNNFNNQLKIQTFFPDSYYFFSVKDGKLVNHKNIISKQKKISLKEQKEFMTPLIDRLNNIYHFKKIRNKEISFCEFFVCLEDFRNIHSGDIDLLINDNSKYKTNKIGGFGFLAGNSKPQRLDFINLEKKYPDKLKYISTNKYNPEDTSMITFLDLKNEFKYLIDLKGHNYSTKLYSFLHCKRVIFLPENLPIYFEWEKLLVPYKHYIPFAEDLSDLIEKINFIENKLELQKSILKNCKELVKTKISQQFLVSELENNLLKQCIYDLK